VEQRWVAYGAIGLIIAAGVAAYANSFSGAFVFDDATSILENPSIRHLRSLDWLHPPGHGFTVEARPFLNLTFALNYAVCGDDVSGYHFVNLLIHLAAAVTLFGLVRRTVRAIGFALVVALLWELHPLQTESVTYIVQRAESLAGLLQLLTLYGFVQAATCPARERLRWQILSVGACLVGMATKEVMITAPVVVLAYDAVFCAGSVAAALRRQPRYYFALASCWIPLAILVRHGSRTAVLGPHGGVSIGQYWLTQPAAIVHYLRLAFWPHPLVMDYGAIWTRSWRNAVAPASVLLLWGAAVVLAWVRSKPGGPPARRWFSFLGFCFFGWLALTSLVPGTRQTLAEHRMYLPLIPVIIAATWAVAAALEPLRLGRAIGFATALVAAGIFGALTWQRNQDYASELTLFAHDAAFQPDNPQALTNYGAACTQAGEWGAAEAALGKALRLRPDSPNAEFDLAGVEARLGRWNEAETRFRQALAAQPDNYLMQIGLFEFLARRGRREEAMRELRPWLKRNENGRAAVDYEARESCVRGRMADALALGQALVETFPDNSELRNHLGISEAAAGHWPEAIACYRLALRLDPANAGARLNLANALRLQERSTQPAQAERPAPL
jgi:tetratricopeptide (TPR) repeat protein